MPSEISRPRRRGGTPPAEHRFKPGQSGNPGGRPKKDRTARDVLWDAFQQPITATIEGRRQQIVAIEALLKAYVAYCGKNPAEIIRAFRFLEGDAPPSVRPEVEEDLDADDLVLLEDLAARRYAASAAMEATTDEDQDA